jgi:N-acyl-D-aspartate/D-glutamate deacylase
MAHDLLITGGTVVDGTGAPGRLADVAVDGDRITAVGDLSGATAHRVIDATGKIVSPGFVDLHTHLDAQIGWDPMLTSSSWHGVTTVLMGNCGVTFAPAAPENRRYLAELMESVEDIPRDAILNGLSWAWESYGEYLDAVTELRPALNVVGLLGHCATRYHVMGDASMSDEMPTDAELGAMGDIAGQAIADGAVGFSTSRILLHKVPDGRHVPGTHAPIAEYVAIAEAMQAAGGGLFQGVFDFQTKVRHEFELMEAVADTGSPVLFSGGVGDGGAEAVARQARWFAAQAEAGRDVSAIVQSRPGGVLAGLAQVMPVASPAWKALAELPDPAARYAALRDDATRATLLAEGVAAGTWYDPAHIHPLGSGERPDYAVDPGAKSLAELAADAGLHPVELIVDRLLESEGRELFNVWFFNRNRESLAAYLALDAVVPGLGDAGAHVGQICDADATTFVLSYWTRDRGHLELAEAVRKLTSQSARILGLRERGEVRPGWYADLNVFDLDRLAARYPTYVNDFPDGKGRFIVRSDGYAATIVNGEIVVEDGEHTGARPGAVLRDFAR